MNTDYTTLLQEQYGAQISEALLGNAVNATLRGQVMWDGKPVIDDDGGGTAGVREPRRPRPSPLAPAAMALSFA